jgi:hypothetical protein
LVKTFVLIMCLHVLIRCVTKKLQTLITSFVKITVKAQCVPSLIARLLLPKFPMKSRCATVTINCLRRQPPPAQIFLHQKRTKKAFHNFQKNPTIRNSSDCMSEPQKSIQNLKARRTIFGHLLTICELCLSRRRGMGSSIRFPSRKTSPMKIRRKKKNNNNNNNNNNVFPNLLWRNLVLCLLLEKRSTRFASFSKTNQIGFSSRH